MQLTDHIYHVGVNDRTKHLFEGQWALPEGVAYNSYLVVGTQVALIDSVEADFFPEFLDKLRAVLGERPIDYLVVNHMEPDHSGSIGLLRQYYPALRVVGNKQTLQMVAGYYGARREDDVTVSEGSELDLGGLTLRFHLVPMLHWPETMVTYLAEEATLFSGDAFGCFGALDGHVVDRTMDASRYRPELERYYAAILGKYGAQVLAALRKLKGLDIRRICSTHGPVWEEHVADVVEAYRRLGAGETEAGAVVCYGSMYGNTRRVAEAVAEGCAAAGLRQVRIYDVSTAPLSYILRDVFRYRGLAVGGPTYNGGLFPPLADLMERLADRRVSGHVLAAFGGFTWVGQAVKILEKYNERLKMQLVEGSVEWKQGATADTLRAARELGGRLGHTVLA